MKPSIKLIAALLSLFMLIACSSDEDPPATIGNLSGTVTAARGSAPIVGAEVFVGTLTTTSASDGSFEIPDVPTGMAIVRAEASGFEPYTANIQIQEGNNNHDISLAKPSIYEADPFTMYLSPNIEEVKGVLFYLTASGDSRPWIRGDVSVGFDALENRQLAVELADQYGLAFIGNDDTHYQGFTPNEAMLSILEDFATASDHPELAHAPLLTFGYSNGGRAAINFAFNYPERTIGAYAYKGVIYNFSDQNWEDIREIPVFLHIGELDDTQVGSLTPGAIPEQYGPNREQGAPWAVGIEKGVGHEFEPPMDFMSDWMEELIIARVPEDIMVGSIPSLEPISLESGWLGDINSLEIKTYMEFQGDAASASWLPNDEIASAWQLLFQ